ncbi:MAG: DUF397 domain-containing protein [Carbonactinosporaceae bacterium]
MSQGHHRPSDAQLAEVWWTKSRRSNPSGNCVEMAKLSTGAIAVRNSRYPDGEVLVYTVPQIRGFIRGLKDGDFDGLLR